jgi:hypothetical protein
MATRTVVTGEGTASRSQAEQWRLGLPANRQRKVLEWARPILRGLSIKQGDYIKNGVSFVLGDVRVELRLMTRGYHIQLWCHELTAGDRLFGRSQAGEATKWLRNRITPVGVETA